MNKILAVALGAFATIPLLAACDDATKPNADNFRQALQRYYDAEPVCASIPLSLPIELPAERSDIRRQQMEALTRAGLLSVEPFRKPEPGSPGSPERTSEHLRYRPTGAGETVVRPAADRFIGGTRVCFAKRQITEVTHFTEPADGLGVRSSRVTYRYTLKDIAPWSREGDIQVAFPEIARRLGETPEPQTDTLVLTNEGWMHERAGR